MDLKQEENIDKSDPIETYLDRLVDVFVVNQPLFHVMFLRSVPVLAGSWYRPFAIVTKKFDAVLEGVIRPVTFSNIYFYIFLILVS